MFHQWEKLSRQWNRERFFLNFPKRFHLSKDLQLRVPAKLAENMRKFSFHIYRRWMEKYWKQKIFEYRRRMEKEKCLMGDQGLKQEKRFARRKTVNLICKQMFQKRTYFPSLSRIFARPIVRQEKCFPLRTFFLAVQYLFSRMKNLLIVFWFCFSVVFPVDIQWKNFQWRKWNKN